MPWNSLLLPLLAGYCALHFCHLSRFRAQKQDGYRLLLESALAGIPLLILGRILTDGASAYPLFRSMLSFCARLSGNAPFIGTGLATLGLGIVLPLLVNIFIRTEQAKWWAIKSNDNGFLRLAQMAVRAEMPVSLTLRNRKIYVGYVVRTPSLSPEEQYISVLPLVSGYRDSATMEMKLTSDYARVYATGKARVDDFAITIPLSGIESGSLFDLRAYDLFREPTVLPPNEPLIGTAGM